MNEILLKNIVVKGQEIDILIRGERIAEICGQIEPGPETEVVNCNGMTAVPGFVNMHAHAGMSMFKGVGEDKVLHEWIDKVWKIEKNIDEEYVYVATKLSCVEMIKSGTTTFNDHYWHSPMAYKAACELGMRATLSVVLCDNFDADKARVQYDELLDVYRQSLDWNPRVKFAVGLHSIYSVDEKALLAGCEFARKHGLRIHMHLCETRKEVEDCKRAHGGLTPVEYVNELGMLGPDLICAHSLWLDEHDIELLGDNHVNCVHNINSNLKLASGYKFMYNELRDAGANICLGTDGCGSSNNMDMLETMKTSAMVQKAWREDPTAMPLEELFDAATVNGAKALGIDAGEIKVGALADINVVQTNNYAFLSPGSFLSNFIYSAHSNTIKHVICNGKFVMKDRRVMGQPEIEEEARVVLRKALKK